MASVASSTAHGGAPSSMRAIHRPGSARRRRGRRGSDRDRERRCGRGGPGCTRCARRPRRREVAALCGEDGEDLASVGRCPVGLEPADERCPVGGRRVAIAAAAQRHAQRDPLGEPRDGVGEASALADRGRVERGREVVAEHEREVALHSVLAVDGQPRAVLALASDQRDDRAAMALDEGRGEAGPGHLTHAAEGTGSLLVANDAAPGGIDWREQVSRRRRARDEAWQVTDHPGPCSHGMLI